MVVIIIKRVSGNLIAVDACRQAMEQCGCLLSQLSMMSALTLEQEHNLHCTFVCSAQQVIAGFLGLSVNRSAHLPVCLYVCPSACLAMQYLCAQIAHCGIHHGHAEA